MTLKNKYFSFLLSIFFLSFMFSQKAKLYNISNSEIVENSLWSIAVNNKNEKIIGTSNSGLLKFDDKNFKLIKSKNKEFNWEYISPIFIDKKNITWFATGEKGKLIKIKDGVFKEIS
jgi:hypothetical protein